ncbi:hypothetical protein BDZ91DRAFT_720809 [Kalaharituber pfeilii]|nr:hypothetical protein BDZ91DRAFT_720809 [Kalaharituber pfeilii]
MCFVRAGMGGRRKASLALNLEELLTQGDLLGAENKTTPGGLSLMTRLGETSTSFVDTQL